MYSYGAVTGAHSCKRWDRFVQRLVASGSATKKSYEMIWGRRYPKSSSHDYLQVPNKNRFEIKVTNIEVILFFTYQRHVCNFMGSP